MPAPAKSLLRFVTTGSVDDGKSTLIGRLLYETKSVFEDQLEAVQKTSARKGLAATDLALLLDGLSAEREQGITIDVAHRYFETEARKFIITDCPGHLQYTRNMVTGASSAECAIILVDAQKGLLTQSRRHGFLISLLQIPHLIVAVNKMDLVGHAQAAFDKVVAEYEAFSAKLDVQSITFIPVSALHGDNIVRPSANMPWYQGPTILHFLETVHVSTGRNMVDFRFPVQCVLRPHRDFRGFAGRIASGTISPGEEVAVLPSGLTSRVKTIATYDGELPTAQAGQSVVITLEDEIDVSRGDLLVRTHNLPQSSHRFEATLCWMDEAPLQVGQAYLLKHTTRTLKAYVTKIHYRLDVDTLHREHPETFTLNNIGRVELQAASPLFFDPFKLNRATGSFILIDPVSNSTAAAGMILRTSMALDELRPSRAGAVPRPNSPGVIWRELNVPREVREQRHGHRAGVLWFTGLSGAGKSTIARALERRLFELGCATMLLDGDEVRHGLCGDLGFSATDRAENIRRVGEVARLFFEAGHLVLCSFISPFQRDRAAARALVPAGRFLEVHVACDLATCQARDPNGLYAKALRGEIRDFTGIGSPYEPPLAAELTVDTAARTLDESVELLLERLRALGWVPGATGPD